MHAHTGLTNKEFKKINNTELKKNNSSLFFKCLKCSIKAVTSAGLNLPASKNTPTLTQEISTQTISNTLESTISKSINSLNQISYIKLNTSIKKFNFASDIYISNHYPLALSPSPLLKKIKFHNCQIHPVKS